MTSSQKKYSFFLFGYNLKNYFSEFALCLESPAFEFLFSVHATSLTAFYTFLELLAVSAFDFYLGWGFFLPPLTYSLSLVLGMGGKE